MAPHIPSAPRIEQDEGLEQLEANTPFHVTCRGDVGYPPGELQLVSSRAFLDGFVRVPKEFCTAVSNCYRYEGQSNVTGGRNATAQWLLPNVKPFMRNIVLFCRAVHWYSNTKQLSSSSVLNVVVISKPLRQNSIFVWIRSLILIHSCSSA